MATLTKTSFGTYQVRWYDNNGARHKSSFKTFDKAKRCKVEKESIFDINGAAEILEESASRMTFKELASRYVDEHLKFSRAAGNKFYVEVAIEKWGSELISRITRARVRPWILDYLHGVKGDSKWEVSSVKKLATYFKRVFSWGVEMEIIPHNPVADLKFKREFKRTNVRSVVIDQDDFWTLVGKFPPWLKRLCIAGWCSGMRIGEIREVKWTSVNLLTRLIKLKGDEVKESANKTVGIEPDLYDALIELQTEFPCGPEDYVFPAIKGGMVEEHFFNRKFRKYADEAGFKDLVFHDLRHCYTTRKRREGHSRSVIKAQTGHHTDSMFSRYDRVDESEIQEMAGFTQANSAMLEKCISDLVRISRKEGVSLGVAQIMVSRAWRTFSLQSEKKEKLAPS